MPKIEIKTGSISIVFDEILLLQQEDGEAMEIDEAELEKILQDYYDDNF